MAEAAKGGKKLKNIRREALLHGFTIACREKRYDDIVNVASRLDRSIIEGSPEITDFVDIAKMKLGV